MRAAPRALVVSIMAGVVPIPALGGGKHEAVRLFTPHYWLFATIIKPHERPQEARESPGRLAGALGTGDGQVMQNGLRRMVFHRSGGAFSMTLGGTVVFGQAEATVNPDAAPGARTLSPEELAMFERLDMTGLRSWAASASQVGQPDRYQYDVVLELAQAAPVELRFYEGPELTSNQDVPGLGDLAAWVRNEIAAIWKRKATPQP